MNSNLISILVGYVIGLNLISLIVVYIKGTTDIISLKNKKFNIICVILSALGGFIGVLLGAEMANYEQDNKLFRRWIPFIVFIEVCIVIYIIYRNMQ